MKKIKKYLLLPTLLGFAGVCNAQNSIVFEMNSGQTSGFTISSTQHLLISTDENQIELFATNENNFTISEVKKIYFSVVNSVLEESKTNDFTFNSLVKKDLHVLNNTGKNHTFEVFDTEGRSVFIGEFTNGNNTIELTNLRNGLFIVKSDIQSFKFVKQ